MWAEGVPAHAGDSSSLEAGPDLPPQDRSQIESHSTTVEPRREHEIRGFGAAVLSIPAAIPVRYLDPYDISK